MRAALLLFLALAPLSARAGPASRLALIVGNDEAHGGATPLPPLRHAQQDARAFAEHLVRFGEFTPSSVMLLEGAGRAQILEAAQRLGARRRAENPAGQTLFVFYFTGHGEQGRLLTADQPLTAADVGNVFRAVDASLSVGLFDACFAGSLESLQAKGARQESFDPVRDLPAQTLNARGTLWFTSSSPQELSFEDSALGGLFTHYLLEAFTHAAGDETGISLEAMWEYARRKTTAHAASFGRAQNPLRFVRDLRAMGPLYFSFPAARSAALQFDANLEGSFLLRYEDASLSERIEKRRGGPLRVPVHSGGAVLAKGEDAVATLELARGETTFVSEGPPSSGPYLPGYAQRPWHADERSGVWLAHLAPATTWQLELGYRLGLPPAGVEASEHHLGLGLLLEHGHFSGQVDVSYGPGGAQYPAWSYRLDELQLRAALGAGFTWRPLRLDLQVFGGPGVAQVSFAGGPRRVDVGWVAGVGPRALITWESPLGPLLFTARVAAVVRNAPLVPPQQPRTTSWEPDFEMGIAIPLGRP